MVVATCMNDDLECGIGLVLYMCSRGRRPPTTDRQLTDNRLTKDDNGRWWTMMNDNWLTTDCQRTTDWQWLTNDWPTSWQRLMRRQWPPTSWRWLTDEETTTNWQADNNWLMRRWWLTTTDQRGDDDWLMRWWRLTDKMTTDQRWPTRWRQQTNELTTTNKETMTDWQGDDNWLTRRHWLTDNQLMTIDNYGQWSTMTDNDRRQSDVD